MAEILTPNSFGNNTQPTSPVLAQVNGKAITEEDVTRFIMAMGRNGQAYNNPQGRAAVLEQLIAHQKSHHKAELESRQCLSGPHKDDLLVDIDGQSAKQFASQGQTRTAALSLKLAQREIFQEETNQWPVLLLDDVLSELDHKRQHFVLNRIQGGQVFITCCEEEKLEGLEGGAAFHIHGGTLVQETIAGG